MIAERGEDVGHLMAGVFAGHKVVDLSLRLAGSLHAQGGAGYQTRWLAPGEQAGTRAGAPRYFGPAVVIDVTGLTAATAGASPRVTPRHLRAWEERHGAIGAGDAVLLRGGWDGYYLPGPAGRGHGNDVPVSRTVPGWPAPTREAIDWLCERGVRCVGTDGFSIGATDDGAVHLGWLPRGMAFVEALSGLGQLPPRGAWFLFLPLQLAAGAAGAGRALGVLPDGAG